ncbi:hypothetical protein JK361_26090 [Streptomyces sp. 5-8]|uniref:Uncharacterized protein n=1 Tax=Streptomyces musisoli TaxID=2802280 RepID=A0ABS1P6M8_9ACTN|nr:hypothetical protein [Streptomyces musisoli]MBL1108017.1 hypothetical protein [Streptomyces musisoli]
MSTTPKRPIGNQEPEPVRTRFARLFRRRPAPAAPSASPRPVPPRPDLVLRLTRYLTAARSEAARWKDRADSYARERDAAYRERAQLLAWLAALHPATTVITPAADIDGEDGWQLLYLVAGGWQMSWHIHPDDVELFRHVTVVDPADLRAQWDGHETGQKYERIRGHVRLLALTTVASDGPSTGVIGEVRG